MDGFRRVYQVAGHHKVERRWSDASQVTGLQKPTRPKSGMRFYFHESQAG